MDKPYRGLAQVYDYLLSGVDYEAWADYMEEIMSHFGLKPRLLVDLACGTGSSTLPWARRDYRVCGVDIAAEMLEVAREKAAREGLGVEYYRQDMRSLQLPCLADLALLFLDGLNYLLDEEDLEKAFNSIGAAVRPGGFFIFHLNEVEKLPAGGGVETTVVEEEGLTLIWDSSYDKITRVWEIKLTAFARQENGLYRKIQEKHRERSYSRKDVERILSRTGWRLRGCFSPYTLWEAAEEDRNIFYAVQREVEE